MRAQKAKAGNIDRPRARPIDPSRWLSVLPDDLLISEINIPGSHNAAAINTKRATRWTCQRHSITAQLEKGIRLLDNEFQSLESLLEECTGFLKANPGETLIMTIQVDDWRKTQKKDHPQVLKALQTRISRLPLILTPHMPKLHECRGRIFLINRINDDPALGTPIDIPDNTPGETLTSMPSRHFEVHVQDQYKGLIKRRPEAHKLHLTIAAFGQKRPGAMLLNFTSGTKPFGRLLDIIEDLQKYFTAHSLPGALAAPDQHQHMHTHPSARRPIGWLLLDYPFGAHTKRQTPPRESPSTEDLPTLIIASNPPAP